MIGIVTNSTSNYAAKGKALRHALNSRSFKRKKVKSETIFEENSNLKTVGNVKTTKRDWNSRGWIRVYCGPYRDVIDLEEASRMVNIVSKATATDVVRDMDLPEDYSLWVIVSQV